MLSINRSLLRSNIIKARYLQLSTDVSSNHYNEYTENPIYPEILNNSIKSKEIRKKMVWHEDIKKLKTVEEKLIKVNMPRYYGYKCVMFGDEKFPYNCLPLTQHYTRTMLKIDNNLPAFYNSNSSVVDKLVTSLKNEIIDCIEFAAFYFHHKYKNNTDICSSEKDKIFGELIIQQINRTLINFLSPEYQHLSEITYDIEPRHEAFWWVGCVNPTKSTRKSREGLKWLKEIADDPTDRVVQYLGKPYIALRHRLPLQQISNDEIDINQDKKYEVPLYQYDARTIGYSTHHRHGTNIPGFFPGSSNEFGLLSYQKRNHMVNRHYDNDPDDNKEALHAQGIQSSFAWLFAQACYQGFSSFNDITYPITTQTIVTNGHYWSFYVYELNTTLIHSNNPIDNPKTNKCWGTMELKMFETIDEHNKCVGFNDDVLRKLINFYINAPAERNINLKPYLGEDEKIISDIKDPDRQEFLERIFKHMTSNRPRHLLVPEIYTWEKIYKIDNNTRPLEAKKRFFERGINPFKRRMDQHTPIYIPRAIRPDGSKSKKRWQKTYYP